MSSCTQELEAGLAKLRAELDASRNDARLANGALAMANANIDLLKGENAKLRKRVEESDAYFSDPTNFNP